MTEELIGCLMKIEALRVASRTSVVTFVASGEPLSEIARQLGVEAIVEGVVIQAVHRVRITSHLIDCATEKQSWTGTYERDLSDVLALQSEVASDISRDRLQSRPACRLDDAVAESWCVGAVDAIGHNVDDDGALLREQPLDFWACDPVYLHPRECRHAPGGPEKCDRLERKDCLETVPFDGRDLV